MNVTRTNRLAACILLAAFAASSASLGAQTNPQRSGGSGTTSKTPPPPPAPVPNYVIGADDVLTISVWREPDASGDVVVRPDGKVTLRIGGDISALGLTTDELKEKVTTELKKFYDDPTVFIQVKQINSRRVFITGSVNRPGVYPLTGPMTVLQLITTAGGLQDFADTKNIMLISATLKTKDGQPMTYKINYKDLMDGKNVAKNNIELRPGDQVIVK